MTKRQMRLYERKRRLRMQKATCCTNNYLKMHHKPMIKRSIRENIIHAAALAGCDIDGDFIEYAGNKYYVHCMIGIVVRHVKCIIR